MKIALGDVDSVITEQPKMGYRIKVARFRPEGAATAFAIVARGLGDVVPKRTDLKMSQLFELRAEAWSSFAHGFSVPDYDEVPEITKLVDHLVASGVAIELE